MGFLSWLRLGRVSPENTGNTHRPAASVPDPSETDVAMMHRALALANEAAAMGEVPVGALVYETATGKVFAEAFNRRETDRDPAAHAEHIAIREAARAIGGQGRRAIQDDHQMGHLLGGVAARPSQCQCQGQGGDQLSQEGWGANQALALAAAGGRTLPTTPQKEGARHPRPVAPAKQV